MIRNIYIYMYILCKDDVFILSLLGLVKIGLGPGTILGCQRTITRIMRSKASTHVRGFTNKNDEVLVGWVQTNPNDVYSMKSCCFSNNPVKDRLHQMTVEVSGTLHFSISVDLLCRVAPWNYFHRRLRKKRKRKTWSLISLDELATFCATFSTPGMEPDGSQRQKKKYGRQGQQLGFASSHLKNGGFRECSADDVSFGYA